MVKALEQAMRVERNFVVANSPRYNGTCEGMVREVVHTLKPMLRENDVTFANA